MAMGVIQIPIALREFIHTDNNTVVSHQPASQLQITSEMARAFAWLV